MKLVLSIALLILVACQGGTCCWSKSSSSTGGDVIQEGGSDASGKRIVVSGRVKLMPALASLPANSQLEVKLQDVSLMDAPSKMMGTKRYSGSLVTAAYSASASIPFTIEGIVPAGTPFYANAVTVSASLSGDGVSYITDTAYYVDLTPGQLEYSNMEITIVKYP